MAELFDVMAEDFEVGEFFSTALSTVLSIYGITFVFNLICLFVINKRFLYLLNVQIGDNFVMSSSSAFNDNKGTLPVTAGLMLLIPYYYNYYVIHYARVLKKTFPTAKVPMPLYWSFSVVITVIAVIATAVLSYAAQLADKANLVGNYSALPIIPCAMLMAALLTCYLLMYATLRRNFAPSYKTEI